MRSRFLPEGRLLHTPENEAACASRDGLRRAMEEETVLEGVAQLCDGAHNLLVSVGPFTGFLPREEAALGIAEAPPGRSPFSPGWQAGLFSDHSSGGI